MHVFYMTMYMVYRILKTGIIRIDEAYKKSIKYLGFFSSHNRVME